MVSLIREVIRRSDDNTGASSRPTRRCSRPLKSAAAERQPVGQTRVFLLMQKTYSFLQILAGLIAASLAIGALTIWTGVPVETAVRLRNMAFAIVGGFAIPCLALWLAARLGVGRSKPLIFY